MDFKQLAKERYSCRSMDSNRPVEEEKLSQILETARLVPSACNLQRQRLKVVRTEATLAKLRECTPCHFSAPVVIILSVDNDTKDSPMNAADGLKFGWIDCGITAAHIALQAHDLGLETTIVGMFDEQKLRRAFDIPLSQLPTLLIPLGYPGEKGGPCIQHKSRLPLTKTVSFADEP